jgi:lauroyl/myristoyl acyltransferase
MLGDQQSKIEATPPLIQSRDVARLLALGALLPVALLPPGRAWRTTGMLLARIFQALAPARRKATVGRIRSVVRDRLPDLDVPRIDTLVRAGFVETELAYLRELFVPGASTTRSELIGREHVERAVESGNGCILWVAPFLLAPLGVKATLWQAGFSVVHLSLETHGPSRSILGNRVINRIRVRTESRYLAERVSMAAGAELEALRLLERRLRENRVVSITWASHARRPIPVPVLGGTLLVGPGAPGLALATGAALLPVFGLRHGDAFRVTVEQALELPAGGSPRRAPEELARRFATVLESYVARWPAEFSAWDLLNLEPLSAGCGTGPSPGAGA